MWHPSGDEGDHVLHWPMGLRAGPHPQGEHAAAVPLELRLTPERAAYWPARRTLFVADMHLGKAAVFRARGLPVPRGTSRATLRRLSQVLLRTQATRLVVLGDFLHARESHAPGTLAALREWRAAHAGLDCVVVQGNHDRHAGRVEASLAFQAIAAPFLADGLAGIHEPEEALLVPDHDAGTGTPLILAGHLHPVVVLRSRLDHLRLPCFWLKGRVLTLPAFGEFTGGLVVDPAGSEVFAVADKVLPLLPRAGMASDRA